VKNHRREPSALPPSLDDLGTESALELVYMLLSLAWGGGSGVIRGATDHDLKVVPMYPAAGMGVRVMPGYAFISKFPFKLADVVLMPAIPAPAKQPRLDLVQVRLADWSISVKQGTEADHPMVPEVDKDCLALARIYLRPSMICIKDSDDSINGYIIDVRSFL